MSGNEDEDERSFRHVGREINDDRRDRAVYRRGNGAPIGTAGRGAIDKSVGWGNAGMNDWLLPAGLDASQDKSQQSAGRK